MAFNVWSYPTRILFGAGSAAETGREAKNFVSRRVLLVTDAGVLQAGLTRVIEAALAASGIESRTFSALSTNPTEAEVDAGVAAYRAAGAEGIVAVGGGAPMDVAKLIVVRSQVDKSFEELDDALGGDRFIPKVLPPVIAIPTTAGTGSEVGRAAVLTVASTGAKTVIFAPSMLPRVAILDPELSLSLPSGPTAATGFDALTHCLEAYLARGVHPMADGIALMGLELVAKHLPRAVAAGADLEARGAMLQAAMMGAAAFQKGLGACHSLSHPLSAELGIHHGLANALCLPAVVDFNEQVVPERVRRAGAIFGAGTGEGACGHALRQLREKLGMPAGLASVGVTRDHLPRLAALAVKDGCHGSNPRPCTERDFLALYNASL
ncbi:MAG TPA: iron-containing alcohol dehydrogenase [Polyangiaceae bacterium]|nr:iron-containing alcohol dehydrogenase [Polyangiaceae bacterium]